MNRLQGVDVDNFNGWYEGESAIRHTEQEIAGWAWQEACLRMQPLVREALARAIERQPDEAHYTKESVAGFIREATVFP